MNELNSKYLTAADLAQVLQITIGTINAYRRQGMPAIKLSSKGYRYDIDEVITWFKSRNVKGGETNE